LKRKGHSISDVEWMMIDDLIEELISNNTSYAD
jgi:hypothetical protein